MVHFENRTEMGNYFKNFFTKKTERPLIAGFPETVYKYLSNERLEYLFPELTIGFPKHNLLNDPYETDIDTTITGLKDLLKLERQLVKVPKFVPTGKLLEDYYLDVQRYNYHKSQYNEAVTYNDYRKKNLEDVINKITLMRDNVGILSLTTDPLNILMWSHYANNHKGVCIGLDTKHDFFKNVNSDKLKKEYHSLRKVTYIEKNLTFENVNGSNYPEIFFNKYIDWSYENEYRMLYDISPSSSIHVEKPTLDIVREIYVGLNFDMSNDKFIAHFRHALIYKVELSSNYKLAVKRIN